MEYIYEKNGKIFHGCGSFLPKESIKVENWKGISGEPWKWYEKGIRLSDDDLILKGLRSDYRGTYYDQDKREHQITLLDEEPDISWTKEKWNHPTDCLDMKSKKWKTDSGKRVEYEKSILRTKRTSEFLLFDKYQLPLPWSELTKIQQSEYLDWRNNWLKAPESGVQPERLEWFK
jgi:hypothetical protein